MSKKGEFVADKESSVALCDQIVAYWEDMILSGKIPHNHRIPSGQHLAQKWGCGYVTVQRAMRRLAARGLARRKPKKGTFVNIPLMTRSVGVLVSSSLENPAAAYFRRLIWGAKKIVTDSSKWPPPSTNLRADSQGSCRWTVRIYDDLNSVPDDDPNSHNSMHNLLRDMQRQDFAGFLEFGLDPDKLDLPAALEKIPRANYSMLRESCAQLDSYDFTVAASKYLVEKGCPRITYFRSGEEHQRSFQDCNGLFDSCAELALPFPDIIKVPMPDRKQGHLLESYAHDLAVEYFQRNHKNERIGVIVSDDVAARGVTMAMIRLGLKPGEDVEVCIQSNQGIEYFYGMPVWKYEMPVQQICQHLTSTLWGQIQGGIETKKVLFKGKPIPPSDS